MWAAMAAASKRQREAKGETFFRTCGCQCHCLNPAVTDDGYCQRCSQDRDYREGVAMWE